MIHKKVYHFKSLDNESELYGIACIPQVHIKGFIQIVHDQKDYIDRYLNLMEIFAQEGYCAFGHDMIGHGNSIRNNMELGYMRSENSHIYFVKDLHQMFQIVCEDFQKFILTQFKKTSKPMLHIMLGVGFGACVARVYLSQYQDVNALILCGDKGFVKPLFKDVFRCNQILHKCKKDCIDPMMNQSLYHEYYQYFHEDSPNCWRVSSKKQQHLLDKDSKCNFMYSTYAIKSFMSLEKVLDQQGWCELISEFLPILILSGYYDPMNRFTRNLDLILEELKRTANKNIFYRYYDEARHDLLFDDHHQEVIKDIIHFIKNIKYQ